jgi:hypothetical protein
MLFLQHYLHQLKVIGNIFIGGQQQATYAAGRVYVSTEFNTKEKALAGIYAPKKVKIGASVVKI